MQDISLEMTKGAIAQFLAALYVRKGGVVDPKNMGNFIAPRFFGLTATPDHVIAGMHDELRNLLGKEYESIVFQPAVPRIRDTAVVLDAEKLTGRTDLLKKFERYVEEVPAEKHADFGEAMTIISSPSRFVDRAKPVGLPEGNSLF